MNLLDQPIPAVIPRPPRPDVTIESTSLWASVAAAMRTRRPSPVTEVMLPRTLPVLTMDDVTPYHLTRTNTGLSLRKGAPPKVVSAAAAEFADGKVGLEAFLDRIGVPKVKP